MSRHDHDAVPVLDDIDELPEDFDDVEVDTDDVDPYDDSRRRRDHGNQLFDDPEDVSEFDY